jgi:hypothetical protein
MPTIQEMSGLLYTNRPLLIQNPDFVLRQEKMLLSRTFALQLGIFGSLCGHLAFGGTIGPDAFGYRASDSASFSFVDITSTGTRILANDDDSAVSANIGFNFNFYGASQNSLFISSNGLLTFGSANREFTATNFATGAPSGDTPAIAVLWDDWSTLKSSFPSSDAVYYQTIGSPGSQLFVVEWHNTFPCCPAGNTGLTFEAILSEGSGNILFPYSNVVDGAGLQSVAGDNGDSGSTAGVGIRDISGQTNGRNLQWSFAPGTAVISNNEAILFTTSTPEPSTLWLLASGTLVLISLRRRRRSSPSE